MVQFEATTAVLDQQAKMLAAVKDQEENAIDRIAAVISASLTDTEIVADQMSDYVVTKSGAYDDS